MASHVLEDSGGVVVVCNSTQGSFRIILSKPAEVPIGSTRFLELVDAGVFTNVALFRVVKGFLVQFGIAPTATALTYWRNRGAIQDDSKPSETVSTFLRGSVSFAGSGPNSRTTNLFIAYKDSISLGAKAPWVRYSFAPGTK